MKTTTGHHLGVSLQKTQFMWQPILSLGANWFATVQDQTPHQDNKYTGNVISVVTAKHWQTKSHVTENNVSEKKHKLFEGKI